ncbi:MULTISPECIES: ABC-type transport auxiliary lipoprotein family protein [unclassified Paraburkholderia]|uniref:ABC-type transport auxiliary lipoprotein family protein n=1 Tax=unclassified Paraburkholderia TaxID=2615204 RepID=UPI002AB2FDE9|nr:MULTISPECIES: ABC-type transport auxiliary lipoprotein family protein [unclassified Paraburkholderia]
MSRHAASLSSRSFAGLGRALLAAIAVGTLVAACAGNQAALSDIRYDLGPLEAQPAPPSLPPLKVLEVSAPPTLDHDGILYRISGDAQRESRYANSRWTMSPARLLTQRLRTSLSSRATVLSGADAVPAPMLKIELTEFEQVFDNANSSSGVLAARATLMQGGKVIAQRSFISRAPASSQDAAGGAAALRAASDDFAGQIGAWLSVQAFAGTP